MRRLATRLGLPADLARARGPSRRPGRAPWARGSARPVALALAALAVAPQAARAGPPGPREDADGFYDPRARTLPATHRLRFGLESRWARLTAAESLSSGELVRFHHAPLMLSFGYQAQFARILAARVGLGVGANVANSFAGMPAVVEPRALFGYQGRLLGLMAGYGLMLAVPPREGAVRSRPPRLETPTMYWPHQVGAELSLTSRVDRVALQLAIGLAMLNARVVHYSFDERSWRPQLLLGMALFSDVGARPRARRAPRGR